MPILPESHKRMERVCEDYILDIVRAAGDELGRSFDLARLSWISRPDFSNRVADATIILRLKGHERGHDAVLIISNPSYPNAVANAVNTARQVYDHVQPAIQATVLLSDFQGAHEDQSFAVFPALTPISENRLVRRIQKQMIEKDIQKWLCELYACSKRPAATDEDIEKRFLKPLSYLIGEERFSSDLRNSAKAALTAVEHRDFQPMFTIQHGDFWLGNILLKKGWPFVKDEKYPFFVIDWGVANLKGYPFVDLFRYALSTTKNENRILENLHAYCRRCELSPRLLPNYVCASIGWLGLHRKNFPMGRYVASSEALFLTARRLAAKAEDGATPTLSSPAP